MVLLAPLFASSPTFAAGAAEPLVVGVFPRRNPTITYTMFSPLMSYLERALGRPVRLETGKNFPAFWRSVEAGRFDLVHFNPYHYLKARERFGYRAILQNEEWGVATQAGTIVVRRDCGCDSVENLRGRTIIFGGGPSAMFSYIVPRYLLQQAGLGERDYETRFAVNPPNAVISVAHHQSEAAGCGATVLNMPMVTERVDIGGLKVLLRSAEMAHLTWAVRGDMAPESRRRLVAAMTGLKGSEAGREVLKQAGLSGLNPVTDEDYLPHERMIKAVFGEGHLRDGGAEEGGPAPAPVAE